MAKRKLNEDLVRFISEEKNEPKWMLELRLKALETFEKMPMPSWGPDLSELHLADLNYYFKPKKIKQKIMDDVKQFAEGMEQFDDMTVVVAKIL